MNSPGLPFSNGVDYKERCNFLEMKLAAKDQRIAELEAQLKKHFDFVVEFKELYMQQARESSIYSNTVTIDSDGENSPSIDNNDNDDDCQIVGEVRKRPSDSSTADAQAKRSRN